jgi:uncharacterized membrane protein YsdA (DUF1294 family)/cold shock CspA family protein
MRYTGRITEWNDDRGYGFVSPVGGGDRAFVHINAFDRPSNRPVVGTLISYFALRDERGRFNAAGIRFVSPQPNRESSVGRTSGKALARKPIGTLIVAAIALGWLASKIPASVAIVYGAMSLLAIQLYAIDKSAAVNNRWRTQESTLHLVGLLGGWPGALFAQFVFRHKTKKAQFQTIFWLTVLLNCAGLAFLATDGWDICLRAEHCLASLIADGWTPRVPEERDLPIITPLLDP